MQVWKDKKNFNSKKKEIDKLTCESGFAWKELRIHFKSAPNPLEIALNQWQTLRCCSKTLLLHPRSAHIEDKTITFCFGSQTYILTLPVRRQQVIARTCDLSVIYHQLFAVRSSKSRQEKLAIKT